MKVYELLEVCNNDTEIVIWNDVDGEFIERYNNPCKVECYWNDYEIKSICNGVNGIDIFVNYVATKYDDLSIEAKIKCMYNYIYNVLDGYYDGSEVECFADIENGVRWFVENEGYTIDKFGNWYDENENYVQI